MRIERHCTIETMRLATPEDFYDGPIYTYYRHHEGYRKRAELLCYLPQPLLVAGCGFGYLVDELLKLQVEAFGIDASWWAVGRRVTERVVYGDILRPLDRQWPSIVTEDLLPYLTDDEAQLAAKNCAAASDNVLHLVTERGEADLNYHSCDEWLALTGQPTISLEGM